MALYHIYFIDHGGNIFAAHHVENGDDKAAIESAHRLNVLPNLGAGFEVWKDDQLVHRHDNRERA